MAEATCTIPDCPNLRRTPGSAWCEKHYARWYRHGDPLAVRTARPRYETSHGYVRIRRPGHPLAHPRDHYVYEHRAVLFDAIGDGAHDCHWCGGSVRWDRTYPTDPDALCVDHLDGVRTNNDLANLVPSCHGCNSGRSSSSMHALDRCRRYAWRFAPP